MWPLRQDMHLQIQNGSVELLVVVQFEQNKNPHPESP